MNETPKEKAQRLGVELVPKGLDIRDPKRDKEAQDKRQWEDAKAAIFEELNKTVAVCERCGKELSSIDMDKKEPCGNSGCPFGTLSYDDK